MTPLDMWQAALETAAVASFPFLVAALIVGLASSLIQAATQLQENVIAFVPKIIAIGVVMAFAGSWVLGQLVGYAQACFAAMIDIAQGVHL